jgi:hypothetical protein
MKQTLILRQGSRVWIHLLDQGWWSRWIISPPARALLHPIHLADNDLVAFLMLRDLMNHIIGRLKSVIFLYKAFVGMVYHRLFLAVVERRLLSLIHSHHSILLCLLLLGVLRRCRVERKVNWLNFRPFKSTFGPSKVELLSPFINHHQLYRFFAVPVFI